MGRSQSEGVEKFLPLPSPAFYLIAVLGDGAMHAYGALKAVEDRSEGRVRFSPSTFYDAVRRLEAQGLIQEADGRPTVPFDDQRRKYFEVTDLGRRVGQAEVRRLEEAIGIARSSRLLMGRPETT